MGLGMKPSSGVQDDDSSVPGATAPKDATPTPLSTLFKTESETIQDASLVSQALSCGALPSDQATRILQHAGNLADHLGNMGKAYEFAAVCRVLLKGAQLGLEHAKFDRDSGMAPTHNHLHLHQNLGNRATGPHRSSEGASFLDPSDTASLADTAEILSQYGLLDTQT